MKTLIFLLLFAPMAFFDQPAFGYITKALGSGDVETLSKYFDKTVEVATPSKENVYSKDQATAIIKDFFSQNKPKSFNFSHQGASKGQESQYFMGDLATSTTTFRVQVYMRTSGDNYIIQEIRFNKQ